MPGRKEVLVRLHLTGLESFKASNGKVTLHVSVSSTGENETRVWISSDGREESTVTRTSLFWTTCEDRRGRKEDSAQERTLWAATCPRRYSRMSPKSLTLSWVDFYRG